MPLSTPLPKIAFCTTCKNRTQHLKRTLPFNVRSNYRYSKLKFIILDYDSRDDLQEWIQEEMKPEIESERVVVYRYTHPGPFRMAHAKNMAHRLGAIEGADILVNVDADNFTPPGFAAWVAEKFIENPECFLWTNMVKDGPERMPRGSNGRIAVSRKAFFVAGGYDERFHQWSPDDKDFNLRLRNIGFNPVEIERQYIDAILHNDKMRFKEYPEAKDTCYDEFAAVDGSTATVANSGDIGVGIVYRNGSPCPILVGHVPTRIFGVGLHKTATTSLDTALSVLGYESAHWRNAHWAKAIWKEISTTGKSSTVDRHYALSDLPIPILFRELDRAYPGSKFILTIRDEDEWIQSVRNHWDPRKNPHVERWDADPFTHKAHTLLYGRRKFDETVFRERYRRHNEEVRCHFRERTDDLLVMDMSDPKTGWHQLCGFLRRQIPAEPYPRAFVTAHHFEAGAGI